MLGLGQFLFCRIAVSGAWSGHRDHLAHVMVLGIACAFTGQIVAAVPMFVAAALLIFICLTLLDDWLFATRRQLMPGDWRLLWG